MGCGRGSYGGGRCVASFVSTFVVRVVPFVSFVSFVKFAESISPVSLTA
jgi:hypothetical protein